MLNEPVALAVALLSAAVVPARAEPVKNVVIVHGAFADGSGWRRVADILGTHGYTLSVVQEPMTSLADDVAATKRVLDLQQGPTLLVGHSYGGVVITEAGNASNVAGLVYIAAFIPDQGESAVGLLSQAPAANNDMRATKDDFLYLDPAAFPPDFAADLPPAEAKFMARSQAMVAKAAASAPVTTAAWHQKKSWALVATRDHNINPDLERGSGQPCSVRFQAGGRSAFDRTGGKGVGPVTLPSTTIGLTASQTRAFWRRCGTAWASRQGNDESCDQSPAHSRNRVWDVPFRPQRRSRGVGNRGEWQVSGGLGGTHSSAISRNRTFTAGIWR